MLLLTPGPVPTSQTELTSRLRTGLQHEFHLPEGAVRVATHGVTLDRIEQIVVDLSGAKLQHTPSTPAAGAGAPVQIGTLHVTGKDLQVQSIPVRLTATIEDLACQWRSTADGGLRIEPAPRGGTGHGRFVLSARTTDLGPVVARVAEPVLAEHGFTLTGSRLHVPAGEGELPFRAELEVARGPMAATVQVTGALIPGPDLSLGLQNLHATSTHPLVSMGLNLLTGTLQRMQERRYGPAAGSGAPWTANAHLSATQDEVQIAGELAQRPT